MMRLYDEQIGAEEYDRDLEQNEEKRVLVVVAHPDDETLWAGGLMLANPQWTLSVLAMCRRSDQERRLKFHRALTRLGATGRMADLDDSENQPPLDEREVKSTVLSRLDETSYDLILTHSPFGEYTRHLRHEETSYAVISLWVEDALQSGELWLFAYEDGQKKYLPRAISNAHLNFTLPTGIWLHKRDIIHTTYGFAINSWEYQTTPREEAFWRFRSRDEIKVWLGRH